MKEASAIHFDQGYLYILYGNIHRFVSIQGTNTVHVGLQNMSNIPNENQLISFSIYILNLVFFNSFST